MAGSKDKFDSILNDEEVIKRLLMDDTFDVKKAAAAAVRKAAAAIDNIDPLLEQHLNKENSRILQGEIDFKDIYDSVYTEAGIEQDVFSEMSEIDEFYENVIEPGSNDDSDDDESSDSTNEVDESVENDLLSETEIPYVENDSADREVMLDTTDSSHEEVVGESPVLPQPIIEEINDQISRLWDNNEALKRQIDELETPTEQIDSINEEIYNLQVGQSELGRIIKENEGMVPTITYVAIGLAIVALLVGIGFGAIGYEAGSNVTDLTKLVMIQEKRYANLMAKDSHLGINNINDKINLLIAKNDHLYKQLNKINSSIQSNSLKPVVDDLQLQNQRTQESMEQLIAKVEALENSKIAIKPPNKRIKVVANVAWVVNLASTKYERSANRAADEFNQKGVPVEVIKVKVNAENWFRLRVKGFKSKQEALAYGTKVKKILNLGSVWVNRH